MESSAVLAVLRASRPTFRDRAERLVFALHALLLVRGARLISVGQAAEAEPPAGALEAEECGHDGWNAQQGTYAFRYALDGSILTLKALLMGDRLLADVARSPDGGAAHVDLSVSELTTDKQDIAASYSNLDSLLSTFGAAADKALGKQPQPTQTMAAAQQQGEQRGGQAGRRPLPDDEPEQGGAWGGGGQGGGRGYPGGHPGGFGVGGGDVYPPGLPRLPAGPGGFVDPGGGMVVGPHHPGFGLPPPLGPLPPGLPPGARFDPYGPPGVPGFEPGRFGGGRGRGDPTRGIGGGVGPRPPVHPDVMQPGRDGEFDDAMYG